MQAQNMVSSHDYSTSSHNLLHNPAIGMMDYLPYWGLYNELQQLRQALENKPALAGQRQALTQAGISDLGRTLYLLEAQARHLHQQGRFSPDVAATFTKDDKQKQQFIAPTPKDIKRRFVTELILHTSPQSLELRSEDAKQQLGKVLADLMAQPSEVRAVKATVNNAWIEVLKTHKDWTSLTPVLFHAFDQWAAQYGKHAGYQPLDLMLDRVSDGLTGKALKQTTPGQHMAPASLRFAIKQALWQAIMPPMLDKQVRQLAMQVATPGIPSLTLHDFYPVGGGETDKLQTAQNRPQVSLSHADPLIKTYQDKALWLLSLRQQYPALDNGILLNPMSKETEYALSKQGVMPYIRDNGQQQVMVLVNMGNPATASWDDRIGKGLRYQDLALQQPTVQDANLNFYHLGLGTGTTYRDVETGERFVIDPSGRLVCQHTPDKGPTLHQVRVLVRTP
jgi:hypothetical protein